MALDLFSQMRRTFLLLGAEEAETERALASAATRRVRDHVFGTQ